MSDIIKISLFDVKLSKRNLFLENFEKVLIDLASKLDDTNHENSRILDIYNGVETSIWFDSFDYINEFSKSIIYKDTICFLLAKDMKFQFIEDKENKAIKNMPIKPKQNPKISAHCVYFVKENKFLIEETSNTPTISTLKRGLKEYQNDISFKPVNRDDIFERLNLFIDNISSIELNNIQIEKYLRRKKDEDGELFNILENPESKITAKLFINSNDMRTRIVDFFTDTFHNTATRELSNIKISYKDENNQNDILELYNNLLYLKIEREIDHKESFDSDYEKLSNMNKKKQRIEYSKNIYKTMIEAYCDETVK